MSFWRLYYHLVWSTKNREPLIQPKVEPRLFAYIVRKAAELECYVYAINGLNSMLTDFNLGLAGPALVGFFAMLPWVLLALFSQQNTDNPQPS